MKYSHLLFFLLFSQVGFGNNIQVGNLALVSENRLESFVYVQFDISWENSWHLSSGAGNWDAAWIFVKYRVGNGEWKHARLHNTEYVAGSGTPSEISVGLMNDAAPYNMDSNPVTGAFLYRTEDSFGNFTNTGMRLRWNYGADGIASGVNVDVRVFAIEMVYVPQGAFNVGGGGGTNAFTSTTINTANATTAPSGTGSLGGQAGGYPTGQSAPANASFPNGYNAFYCMKYEISQQQYVDFLNTLTYTQQAARTIVAPNSAEGTPALVAGNANRNGIDIQTPGTSSTVPAVYACNLNGTNTYNQSDDGQYIACNYLSWDDLIAYLDWAALRPMTELEYEKSCRGGNQNPAASEFAWGNTSATALSGLSNASTMSETASSSSANIAYNNAYTLGPVRTGIFATGSTARLTSGAGFYGNMELSGNLWERVVTLGNPTGRTFSGVHGNGTLTSGGAADVSGWPAAAGTGWKGGSWLNTTTNSATTSDRAQAANADNTRSADAGGRGVRTISSGIVTNGLVFWLDAGIPSSYPTSGTTWTDLSGNKNNGTLTNGPTFNSGSIVFDGVNDYINIPDANSLTNTSTLSINCWVRVTSFGGGFCTIIGKGTSDADEEYCILLNSSSLYFDVGNAAGPYTQPTYTFNANTWYNISCVHSRSANVSSLLCYVNGVFLSNSTINSGNTPIDNSSPVSIGSRFYNSIFGAFNGDIVQVSMYNRVLSASEVLQNFNAQKALFGL